MSEPFNPEKYEKLQGLPLGMYAIETAKQGQLPPDCVQYVKSNADRWDGQHLEMGIFFLSKIDSTEAWHEIARHLDHPLKHIRYTVLGFINHQMTQIDACIIERLRSRLAQEVDDFEKPWLEEVYKNASKKFAG